MPQVRELAIVAILCTLAVAARVEISIPNFKAIYAIVIIAGIAFGPDSGFLVSVVSALSSTLLVLFLLGNPMQEKLERIQVKCGMINEKRDLT